jgi:predicted alpha-1,6-mannanase (GH76 family)
MNLSKTSHTLYFILTIVLISGCNHQLKINKRAGVLAGQLQHWYDNESGLWETTSWWNGANALTALIRYGQLSNTDSLIEVVENTFLKTKQFRVSATENTKAWFCTNYINDYYDDEGWWALAWLDAWEWTGNPEYLDMARYIFKDITSGWDETCGGGIFWRKGVGYKSTISNELTLLLGARLHMARAGPVNGKSCLQWSVDIWNWLLSVNLINEEGLLQDGVGGRRGDCKINPRVWTYNQGVILSGLVFLSEITGDKKYINQADRIAVAAINNLVDDAGVLYEINCEPARCNGDAEQFKGIFMRHLALLHQYSPKKEYGEFIALNAKSIWENAMQNGSMPPGVSWSIFSEKSNAATTSSALDALNAAFID